jgi:hypothetical protein
MLPPPELSEFIATFAAFQIRIGELVDEILQSSAEASESDFPTLNPKLNDWPRWVAGNAHPRLQAMRAAVERGLDRLAREHPLGGLAEELQRTIAQQPETVSLDDAGAPASVPLRRYLEVALWPNVQPAFATLGQTLTLALRDVNRRIAETQRTLDYYVLAVQRHEAEHEVVEAEELARTGSERVEQLIGELQRGAASRARRAKVEFVELSAQALADACAPYRAHRPEEILRRIETHDRASAAAAVEPGPTRRAVLQLERSYRALLPVAGQLASELRSVYRDLAHPIGEQPSRAPEHHAPPLTDPSELGAELPLGYRRLFTSKALDSADLYLRRPTLEREYADAITRWRAGVPQWILVHGDRGVGKRTLTNHVLARMCSEASLGIHWLRLGPGLRDEQAVVEQLARVLGCGDAPRSFAKIAVAAEPGSRRRAIVVENAERLLVPSSAGVARMADFLGLVARTAASTLWLLLMATPAAVMILHRLGFADRIPTVLHVESMTADELRTLIAARHRLSGFELEFDDGNRRMLDRLTRLRAASASEIFHQRLRRLTGGNPRQALYTWLEYARVDPRREGRIVVEVPPSGARERLAPLPLPQRLILALLAQHGSLTGSELATALAASTDEVEGDLGALWAKGLLIPSREHEQHWTLPPTIAHPLVMELRSINML